jgi:hypothetical protein
LGRTRGLIILAPLDLRRPRSPTPELLLSDTGLGAPPGRSLSDTDPSSDIGIPIISPFSLHSAPTSHLNASSSSERDTSNSFAMLPWIATSSASVGRTGILVAAFPDEGRRGERTAVTGRGEVLGTPTGADAFFFLFTLVRMTKSAFCSVSNTANHVASRLPARYWATLMRARRQAKFLELSPTARGAVGPSPSDSTPAMRTFVGILIGALESMLAMWETTAGGMANLQREVRNASRGVWSPRTPQTDVKFWSADTTSEKRSSSRAVAIKKEREARSAGQDVLAISCTTARETTLGSVRSRIDQSSAGGDREGASPAALDLAATRDE